MRTPTTPPRSRRLALGLAGALFLAFGLACTEKEADFFGLNGSFTDFGQISTTVLGTSAGADVTVSGNGINRTQLVTSNPYIFDGLPYGTYGVSTTFPSGQVCTPDPASVILSAANPSASVQFNCSDLTGSLRFDVTGLNTGISMPYSLSGAAVRAGNLLLGQTTIDDLPVGTYNWAVTEPIDWNCVPLSGSFSITAGLRFDQSIDCEEEPGSITATVNGATATVGYTGPASGSAAVGSSGVTFDDLPPGAYTFTITNPSGFNCTPPTSQVTLAPGGSQSVQFTCAPSGGGQPMTVFLDLAGFQGSPGAVPSGTYTRNLLDQSATVVGNTSVSTIGSGTFYGTSPDRLGFSPGSGYRFGTTFDVNGQPFATIGVGFCATSTYSGSNFINITYRDAGLAQVGTDVLASGPGCFWGTAPANTAFADITASGGLSLDIYTIQFWR